MPKSLTAWFEGYVARQPNWKPHAKRRPPRKPKPEPEPETPDCVVCQIRLISAGESQSSIYARRLRMCGHCYNTRGLRAKQKVAATKARGRCTQCHQDPIAAGKTRNSIRARKRRLCWKCYRGQQPHKIVYARGVCGKCGDEPVAGGESQPALQAAKLKLGWNCYAKRIRTYGAGESVGDRNVDLVKIEE